MANLLVIATDASSGSHVGYYSSIYRRAAQQFTPGQNWRITGATIPFKRINGTANVPIEVRIETDSSDKPSGTLAHANATASIPTFTDVAYVSKTVTFTPFTLNANTKYWLVYKTSEDFGGDEYYFDKSGSQDTYSGGGHNFWISTSGVWSSITAVDGDMTILGTVIPAGTFAAL